MSIACMKPAPEHCNENESCKEHLDLGCQFGNLEGCHQMRRLNLAMQMHTACPVKIIASRFAASERTLRVEEDSCFIISGKQSAVNKGLPWKRGESHDSLTFHGILPVLNKGKDDILL